MGMQKTISSHSKISTARKHKKHHKSNVTIYPMMPRKYTAFQRAALRKYEKQLMAGRKVIID